MTKKELTKEIFDAYCKVMDDRDKVFFGFKYLLETGHVLPAEHLHSYLQWLDGPDKGRSWRRIPGVYLTLANAARLEVKRQIAATKAGNTPVLTPIVLPSAQEKLKDAAAYIDLQILAAKNKDVVGVKTVDKIEDAR